MSIDTVRRLQKSRALNALTRKIGLAEVEGIDGWALEMTIEMDDGSTFRGTGDDIDLDHLYLGWDLACDKFRQLAQPHLGRKRADEIIELVGTLEQLDSVTPITQRLTPRSSAPERAAGKQGAATQRSATSRRPVAGKSSSGGKGGSSATAAARGAVTRAQKNARGKAPGPKSARKTARK